MPFRQTEFTTTLKCLTFARMPSLIHKAAVSQNVPSNTRYINEAVCMRLATDLGIPLASLLDELPATRRSSKDVLTGRAKEPRTYAGSKNNEEVI